MLKTCALIVTKDPDSGLLDRINSFYDSVEHIFVVDNGSTKSSINIIEQVEKRAKTQIIWNQRNEGVCLGSRI